MDIGQRIAYYRNSLNLTQAHVALSLGISRSAVNAWEMGFSSPQLKHLIALAKLFHVTVDALIADKDMVVVDITSLPPKEQSVVMTMIDCLSSSSK